MSKYPMAERPSQTNVARTVHCVHCNGPLAVGTWDKWNGFLVECPNCHAFHGKRWSVRPIAFASLFLNGLAFFFTMRPLRALAALITWALFIYLTVPRVDRAADWIQASLFGFVMLGPLIINMVLLVRHQSDVDRHPLATSAA